MNMKPTLLNSIWAVSLLAALSMPVGLTAQEQSGKVTGCSKATLEGTFIYISTGTLLDSYVPAPYAGPFAEVGRQTFDGKGNTNGTATLSSNGNISAVTIEGTYRVKRDCTGTMTLNIPALDATVHADFVIGGDGTQIRAISTDAGVVESRVYSK
jgi:hypothetical protein